MRTRQQTCDEDTSRGLLSSRERLLHVVLSEYVDHDRPCRLAGEWIRVPQGRQAKKLGRRGAHGMRHEDTAGFFCCREMLPEMLYERANRAAVLFETRVANFSSNGLIF